MIQKRKPTPVFFDPAGWRKPLAMAAAVVLLSVAATALGIFIWSLFHTGVTPAATHAVAPAARAVPATPQPAANPRGPIVAAFFAPWEEAGLNSFRAHADALTHLLPEWLHLGEDGESLEEESTDPRLISRDLDLLRAARQRGIIVHAVLNNVTPEGFDPLRVHELLTSPEKQQALAERLRTWLLDRTCDGLNLDLENFATGDAALLPAFLERLSAVLHEAGLQLSVDLEVENNDAATLQRVAAVSDFVVLMAYDEHNENDEPGPIASQTWFSAVLAEATRKIPAEKLVIGLGNYGYDWTKGVSPAESISLHEALVRASTNAAGRSPQEVVRFDKTSLNPTFLYQDAESREHEVWFLDAVTAANQWKLIRQSPARGAALWVLGSEDEGVWSFFDRRLPAPPQANSPLLRRVSSSADFDFSGEGEILSVAAEAHAGRREIEVDRRTGFFGHETYQTFATPLVIRREHRQAGKLALTFDDGPDPRFTPQILDRLDLLQAPASFFVVGGQAAKYPELVQRIWQRGDDLGNHTFSHPNMERVDTARAVMEINSTQRVLQGLIGHSTTLFRPPFRVDADIHSVESARTVVLAARQHCVTVAASIDPHDWDPQKGEGPAARLRTGEDIAEEIIAQTHASGGNIILLHDGGGNRTATLRALEIFVPALRAEGYRFVTVSELAGQTRLATMPPVAAGQGPVVRLDRAIIGSSFGLLAAVRGLFYLAIGLGVLRVVLVTSLALLAHWRQRRRQWPGNFRPAVTALIPAYNERTVIAQTVESLLRSDEPPDEILVIDDGSTDGTADFAEAEFEDEPTVRVLRQTNAGKSSALNLGIAEATGDVLVCADADTQFAPDAVGKLVRHFADPRVGAVAGNVKVGNRVNVLTRWQSLEYITSQNLDRLAYSLGDAITVVPGAVGAWRRRAVLDADGYLTDTLAEDMDLTWRLHRAGWRVRTEQNAVAYTEAPETLGPLLKQRFRWTFGTLQCLWKHRGAVGHCGWFGGAVLPSIWLFNVFFQILAPLVDLQVVVAIVLAAQSWWTQHFAPLDWQPDFSSVEFLTVTVASFAAFFALDLVAAFIGLRLDREHPKALANLFWQRFAYRQVLYCVLLRAVTKAVCGTRMCWGKLERTGSSEVPVRAARPVAETLERDPAIEPAS